MRKRTYLILLLSLLCTIAAVLLSLGLYANSFSIPQAKTLSHTDKTLIRNLIETKPSYILQKLPYPVIPADLPVQAYSAIVIDASNGSILFEKNADALIPPASMTKLVLMYVVFEEIKRGTISLTDIVPLQKESWAINAPPESSLMFLGEGQRVSLDELLTGLAVVSGNDAAVAVAQYVSGSVDKFIERMNLCVKNMGLQHTHFVESSGYSERNITTAREFASFCKVYIETFPESLERYHSLEFFTYPKAHNLKEGLSYTLALQSGKAIEGTLPVTQSATNKILGKIQGADGIKTGFIYESGYNLALTVKREGTRFISVTMGGPGRGSIQGNEIRLSDAQAIMKWAFTTFKTVFIKDTVAFSLPVFEGTTNTLIAMENPYALRDHYLTLPLIPDLANGTVSLTRIITIPSYVKAPVAAGDILGYCSYMLGDICIEKTELMACTSIGKGSPLKTAADSTALLLYKNKASISQLQEQFHNPQIE